MKLYCIDLSKLNKIELSEIQKRFKVPIDSDELFRLKLSGYNTIYIDEETNKVFFYTLNNSKKTIQVGDYLKNLMIDLKPLGFGAKVTVNEHISKMPTVTRELNEDELEGEYNRILDKIHQLGMGSITIDEANFLNKHRNLFD